MERNACRSGKNLTERENLRIYFVLCDDYNDESEASNDMLEAYEASKQHVTNIQWVKETEVRDKSFKKQDIIIFEKFKGECFQSFKERQLKTARILGPWCIKVCLMEALKIPSFVWPIYNVSMFDCIVSCSHLAKKLKGEIEQKVRLMGGYYVDNLIETNTHLVTENVRTEKYAKATGMNIKIMLPSWVDEVWRASQSANVHCNNDRFASHKCGIFQNLEICTTGLTSTHERDALSQLIAQHGGHLSPQLHMNQTNILICVGESGMKSQKYRAARNVKHIECVTLDWVQDSIKKGYAMPTNVYAVKRVLVSTPNRGDVNPDFSTVSAIGVSEIEKTTVEESVLYTDVRITTGVKRKDPFRNETENALSKLDVKKAKKRGQFLDGCIIYLVGFEPEHRDKISKILNTSGATRYDDMSDRVTHVIVGDPYCHEFKLLQSRSYTCVFVSTEWLLQSIDLGQPAPEDRYSVSKCNTSEAEVKMNQKDISLLRTTKTCLSKDLEWKKHSGNEIYSNRDIECELVKQYSQQEEDTLLNCLKDSSKQFDTNFFENQDIGNKTSQSKVVKEDNQQTTLRTSSRDNLLNAAGGSPVSRNSSQMSDFFNNPPEINQPLQNNSESAELSEEPFTMCTERDTQSENIFYGLHFLIDGFDEDQFNQLKENVILTGGKIVSRRNDADYVVLPTFVETEVNSGDGGVNVNDLWIKDCLDNGIISEIMYYHRPFTIKKNDPLVECFVTISGYTDTERVFLRTLVLHLGGISQDRFARLTSKEKNVQGNTHLIIKECSGKKYAASVKWGIPAVNKDWLLECARVGSLVSVDDYRMVESDISDATTNQLNNKSNGTPSCSRRERTLIEQNQVQNFETLTSTPKHNHLQEASFSGAANLNETPEAACGEVCSQVTPVNKLLEDARRRHILGTPGPTSTPKQSWMNCDTPKTPYGAFIEPNPSKTIRKEMLRYINQFPDFVPPPRRNSTPLSELKKRLWDKFSPHGDSGFRKLHHNENNGSLEDEVFEVPGKENQNNCATVAEGNTFGNESSVNNKLLQLQEMLTTSCERNRRSGRPMETTVPTHVSEAMIPDSQPFTVKWDYGNTEESIDEDDPSTKIFIVSGVSMFEKNDLEEKIKNLGAQVLSSYQSSCTHLICVKPGRNEKTLACMAAGKWILHSNYIIESAKAGKFLEEEKFEFGNSEALTNINVNLDSEINSRMGSIHYWRKEVSRRGYGVFHDMRAIVVANKSSALINVIEAGGGTIVKVEPPFHDTVHATHCLLEPKSVSDFELYTPLAQQGIFCVNSTYLDDVLNRRVNDAGSSVLPYYSKYFNKNSGRNTITFRD